MRGKAHDSHSCRRTCAGGGCPGSGKTTLALAFAKAMNVAQNRVQFTPDVLPADITGFTVYNREKDGFFYRPGAVMCNILLADEINRTSPKTQAALLEVMEEGSVTVDGVTRSVPSPFLVIATQNPVGSAGTQLLPQSQLDRFLICFGIGYPDAAEEMDILKSRRSGNGLEDVRPVISSQELMEMKKKLKKCLYTIRYMTISCVWLRPPETMTHWSLG